MGTLFGALGAAQSTARMPPIRAIRLIADWLLYSPADAALLPQFAGSILHKNWYQCARSDELAQQIRGIVKLVRAPGQSTDERVNAVDSLSALLPRAPYWAQIANFLYHRLFSWPLLVSPFGGAISLPIAIDIRADSMSEVLIDQPAPAQVDWSRWVRSIEHAVGAAKTLWLAKHGNCGAAKAQVSRAGVVFGLRHAERVAAALPGKVTLDGRSM